STSPPAYAESAWPSWPGLSPSTTCFLHERRGCPAQGLHSGRPEAGPGCRAGMTEKVCVTSIEIRADVHNYALSSALKFPQPLPPQPGAAIEVAAGIPWL